MDKRTVYIISGPLGVGKSTVTRQLEDILDNTVLIEGDVLNAMFWGKERKSWAITWENIMLIAQNYLRHDFDVIIDYVVEEELQWICNSLAQFNVQIKYIVLVADEASIRERLVKRKSPEDLERSLFLLNKLKGTAQNKDYIFNTSNKQPIDIARNIIESNAYLIR